MLNFDKGNNYSRQIGQFKSLIAKFDAISWESEEETNKLQDNVERSWTFYDFFCNFVTCVTPICFHNKVHDSKEVSNGFTDKVNGFDDATKRTENFQVPSLDWSSKSRIFYRRYMLSENLKILPNDYYVIRFHMPFESCPHRKSTLSTIIQLVNLYIVLKLSIINLIYMRKQYELSNWQPDLSLINHAKYTDRCIVLETLNKQDQDHIEMIEYYAKITNYFGSMVQSKNILLSFCCSLMLYVCILKYSFAIGHRKDPHFRLHSLTFRYMPLLERLRVKNMITNLMDIMNKRTIYGTSKLDQKEIQLKQDICLTYDFNTKIYHDYRNFLFVDSKGSLLNELEFKNILLWFRKKKLIQALKNKRELKQQQEHCINNEIRLIPSHLKLSSHRKQLRFEEIISFAWSLSTILLAIVSLGGVWYAELSSRVEHRLEEFHCRRWNSAGISRKWLDASSVSFEYNANQQAAYEQFAASKQTWSDWANVAFGIELKNSLSLSVVLFNFELIILATIFCNWFAMYIIIYASIYNSTQEWLEQIHGQLKIILQMMQFYLEQSEANHDNHNKNNHNNDNFYNYIEINKLMLLYVKRIEKSLQLTYINFLLFQSDNRFSRSIFRFLVKLLALINLCLVLLSATLPSGVDDALNRYLTCFIGVYTIGMLNVCGLISVKFTSKIQEIFNLVNLIMAKSIRMSMESNDIVLLWRRQIMSISEAEKAFGLNILGFDLTYSNFIQFNSYILGGALYIIKENPFVN